MQSQAPRQDDQRSAFRAGQVVELVAVIYPGGHALFASLFNPTPRQVIEVVCRLTDREPPGLVVQSVTAEVHAGDASEPETRVVAVELRLDVDVGQGPLVAVVNGMSARALRDAVNAMRIGL
jgi:hypothetical protein